MTDSTCKILIETLYKKLAKNGLLIIGNYRPKIFFKSWMELGLEWYLTYRSQEEFLYLAKDINCRKSIRTESLGLFQFLIFKK